MNCLIPLQIMILEGSGVMNLNPSNTLLQQQPAWTDGYPTCNGKGTEWVSVSFPWEAFPSAAIRLRFPTSCLKNTGFIQQRCGDEGKWRTLHAGGPDGLLGLQTEAHGTFSIVSSQNSRQPGRERARRYARREGHLLMLLTAFGWDIKIG